MIQEKNMADFRALNSPSQNYFTPKYVFVTISIVRFGFHLQVVLK